MKPRVILIEDYDCIRNALAALLRSNGCEVVSTSEPDLCPIYDGSGKSCPQDKPCGDLLLTHNHLHNKTALEFIEEQGRCGCKENNANKAIMSGCWTPDELRKAEQLGCKVFYKPFSPEEILSWLEERKKVLTPKRELAKITN